MGMQEHTLKLTNTHSSFSSRPLALSRGLQTQSYTPHASIKRRLPPLRKQQRTLQLFHLRAEAEEEEEKDHS